jgi:hypothetical protein
MRTTILALALLLTMAPASAQQKEEPATLEMDSSGHAPVPSTLKADALEALNDSPEEHAGVGAIEGVAIVRVFRRTTGRESIYLLQLASDDGATTPFNFGGSGMHFFTMNEAIGRALVQQGDLKTRPWARVSYRVAPFGRWDLTDRADAKAPKVTIYAAEVTQVEWVKPDGTVLATVP